MKKILITGGAGFIGSNLAEFFKRKKMNVNILDNLSSGFKKNLPKNINFFRGDVRNINDIAKASKGCDAIFHLAAISSLQETISNPENCMENNVLGTINVIKVCLKKNITLVFSSTCAVYPLNIKIKFRENDTNIFSTPYAISKISSENLINFYFSQKKLKGSILRFFNVYGPKQNPNSIYSAVIPKFISLINLKKKLKINGNGEQSRDFIHVNDVCLALYKAYRKPLNETFNIGTGKPTSVNELANMIIKIKGEGQIIYGKKLEFDAKFSCANIRKTFKRLNFKSKIKLFEGIKELIKK